MSQPPTYEPEVIERYAGLLDRRARSVVRGFTLTGALLGAAVGALPLSQLGHVWPVPHVYGFATLVVGLAVGGFLGYAAAKNRAGMLRLQAQTTLCQLHTQRTTLALWLHLKDREPEFAPAADLAVAVAPEPEPEPKIVLPLAVVPEPAPEPPAAPEPEPEPALPHVLVTAPPPTTFVPVHAATPAPPPPPLSPPHLG